MERKLECNWVGSTGLFAVVELALRVVQEMVAALVHGNVAAL